MGPATSLANEAPGAQRQFAATHADRRDLGPANAVGVLAALPVMTQPGIATPSAKSILMDPPMLRALDQDRRDLPQLLDNRLRILQPSQMCIA